MKRVTAILITLGILSTTVFGDDYEDAGIAYEKKEYKKAFKLYNQACDGGDFYGCSMVGAFFEDGSDGVERNTQEALAYYGKACDMGYENGCESYTKLQGNLPVCTEDELSFANNKRYFEVSSSLNSASILADSNTISIDKKNKIIKVWTTRLATEKGRQATIESMGKYNNYDNYGYDKDLDIINYGNMKHKNDAFSYYKCDGSVIHSNNSKGEWNDIIPGSVMEGMTQSIMKKYNLK